MKGSADELGKARFGKTERDAGAVDNGERGRAIVVTRPAETHSTGRSLRSPLIAIQLRTDAGAATFKC